MQLTVAPFLDMLQAKIVQRGAVPLLVTMLSSQDTSLKEMAAFALGRLVTGQAGIANVSIDGTLFC